MKRLLILLVFIVSAVTLLAMLQPRRGPPPQDVHYRELPFELLRSWTYIEGKTPIPAEIREWDGRAVQMTGYMLPLTQAKEVTEFVLVPYLFGCCFGGPPAPNHMVLVQLVGGARTPFLRVPIYARGTFRCGETRQDGQLVSLYRLEAQQIISSR